MDTIRIKLGSRGMRLAVLASVLVLGGCIAPSTRYYAEDAGYGYYDPGYDQAGYGYDYGAAVASPAIYFAGSHGYADPWVYPYASLDLFYFGPYSYLPRHSFHSTRGYFAFGHGYPYAYQPGFFGYAGFAGYGYWNSFGAYRGGFHDVRHRSHYRSDRRSDHRSDHRDRNSRRSSQAVDARTRAVAQQPAATPTRRALLGGSGRAEPAAPVTRNRSSAELISSGSTRAALRGELGSRARAEASRSAAPAQRPRTIGTDSRRRQSPAASRTPIRSTTQPSFQSAPRSTPRAAAQRVAPRLQTSSTPPATERATSNRSRVLDRAPRTGGAARSNSTNRPTNRPNNRSTSRPVQSAAPQSQRGRIRAAAPAATPARQPAPAAAATPARARPAPAQAPAPTTRESSAPPRSAGREARREALSRQGGDRNGRRRRD
ncbi:MAG: hypothetical protein CVV18_01040 [Gammaproteobacteria bacterium HGW-Gammaproteobacteria-8]|nr:MAG: hypothetical protein CVV18_01040 [Gammaproteobacteria bacterium HGW-Gammaproteobacteria-8]